VSRHPVEYDFEAWAALSIRLVRARPHERAAILHGAGAVAVWATANQSWALALGRGVAAGDLDLLRRYTARLEQPAPRAWGDEVTQSLVLPTADAAIPFASGGWTLERYARLCAELQERPEQAERIYARAELQAGERRAWHEAWQARLVADAALHARYCQLLARESQILRAERLHARD
jgi:hypothetical protein